MTDDADDEALMQRVARGDEAALRRLMDAHMGRAIRLGERIAGSALDADEIAQEAFVRVWRHAARFDGRRARFTTWLYRIVVNLALDRKRRRPHLPIEHAEHVPDGALSADDMLLARERQRLAEAALASLPERQRAAIALVYLEGLSGREGAAILEVSEKSFESLLSRGRAACRQFTAAALAAGGGSNG